MELLEYIPKGKKILVRIDTNGPLNKKHRKIEVYADAVKGFYAPLAKFNLVVFVTHQGRPGKKDYVEDLSYVAEYLSELSGSKIEYRHTLTNFEDFPEKGMVLLKNVRSSEDEFKAKRNELVKAWESYFDIFIFDAPQVMHRTQTSVIFPELTEIEVCTGPVFEKEVETLEEARKEFSVAIIGGSKPDKLKYAEMLAKRGWTVFLGSAYFGICKTPYICPIDVVKDENGMIRDIGEGTVKYWKSMLSIYKFSGEKILLAGPLGDYEHGYLNTLEIVKYIDLVLGGHGSDLAKLAGMSIASITSGGAALAYLASTEPWKELPGLRALKRRGIDLRGKA